MGVKITGAPPVPGLSEPETFNTKALNLLSWITSSMLDQIEDMDAADFFDVQADPYDETPGKNQIVGAWGWGGSSKVISNLNDPATPSGIYEVAPATAGTKPSRLGGAGFLIVHRTAANSASQTITGADGASYTRTYQSSSWGGWRTQTPIGSVTAYAGTAPPEGWIICNGSAISRTTYAALYSALGARYGGGDGSTTFNIPDLRGEFIRGFDAGRGVDSGRGLGSHQGDMFRSHTHNFPTYGYNYANKGGSSSPHAQGHTTSTTHGAGGHETRPRNVALNYCIKY